MIVKQYIKDFEKMGLGMFVHFGLYSIIGRGEWIKFFDQIPTEEYVKNMAKFKVNKNWAHELVRTAKEAGCKYITLTTRHHDGFSLYDTCGLNTYDAVHSATGRDLVREFVDECNKQGIIPYFYHTLIDWWKPEYESDFKAYLEYLRASVEILCKNYGKIGGLWFDGMWAHTDWDWEEDAMYGMIRKYQPDAMIINNTGMGSMGTQGHIELDSVTFERGKPNNIDLENKPKYLATEMCQIFGEQWGYAPQDLNYKPVSEILQNLIDCRRYKANLLLNVGPMPNGMISNIDKGYFEKIGAWMKYNSAAVRDVDYVECNVNQPDDFVMYDNTNKCYYLFVYRTQSKETVTFDMDKKVTSMKYLDGNAKIDFTQDNDKVTFVAAPSAPGINLLVRVAKITVK